MITLDELKDKASTAGEVAILEVVSNILATERERIINKVTERAEANAYEVASKIERIRVSLFNKVKDEVVSISDLQNDTVVSNELASSYIADIKQITKLLTHAAEIDAEDCK